MRLGKRGGGTGSRALYRAAMRWFGLGLGLYVCMPLMAVAVDFKPPKRGIPGRREGGGTRDPLACTQGNPSRLTALLPGTNLGLTTAEYPRFFWFIPKTKAKYAEFTLAEVNDQMEDQPPIYKTTFSIAGTPGIASVTLPNTAALPPLVVGKDYHWTVGLICNANDRQKDIRVDGWIQRVTPTPALASQLTKANPRDRVLLYANNGLWFDTVTALAEQRCTHPGDSALSASWAELLTSVQLSAIAAQPLIQHCQKPGE